MSRYDKSKDNNLLGGISDSLHDNSSEDVKLPAEDDTLGTNLFSDMLALAETDLDDMSAPVETDSDDPRLKFLPCGDTVVYAVVFNGKMIFTFSVQQIRNVLDVSQIVKLCNVEYKHLTSSYLRGNVSDEGVIAFLTNRFKGLLSDVGYATYRKEDLHSWHKIIEVTRGISLQDSLYIVPLMQKLASKKNKNKFGRLPNVDKDSSVVADQFMSLTSLFGPGPRLYSLDELAANDEIAPFDSLANIQGSMPKGIIKGNILLKGGKTKLSNEYLQHRSIVFRNCEVTFEPYAEMVGVSILNLLGVPTAMGSMAVAQFVECARRNRPTVKCKFGDAVKYQEDELDPRLNKQCIVITRKMDFIKGLPKDHRILNATRSNHHGLDYIEHLMTHYKYEFILDTVRFCIADALVLNTARKLSDFETIFKGNSAEYPFTVCNLDQAFNSDKFVSLVDTIRQDSAWRDDSLDVSPDNRIRYIMQCKAFNNYVSECFKSESRIWGALTNSIAVFEMFCHAQLLDQNRNASYELGEYLQSVDSNLARYSADYNSEFCKILQSVHVKFDGDFEKHRMVMEQMQNLAFIVKGLTRLDPIFVASVCSCGVELHFDLICVMTAVIRSVAGIICQHIDAICKYMRIAPIYVQDASARVIVDKKLHLSFVNCDISTRLDKLVEDVRNTALNQFNGLSEGSIKLLTNPQIVESLPYYQNIRELQRNKSDSDLESEKCNMEIQRRLLYPELADEEYEVKLQESVLRYADALQKCSDKRKSRAPVYSSPYISSLCTNPNDISILFDKKGPLRVRCIDQNAKLTPVPIVASYSGLLSDLNKLRDLLIKLGDIQVNEGIDDIVVLSVLTEKHLGVFVSRLDGDSIRTLSTVLTRIFNAYSALSLHNATVVCDFAKSLALASKGKNTSGVVLFGELYRNLKAKLDEVSQCISSRQLFSEPLVRDVFNYVLNNPGINLKDLIAKFSMKGKAVQNISRLSNLETQEIVLKAVVGLLESDYLSIRNSQTFTDYLYYQLDLGRRGFHEYFEVYERLKQQFDNIPSKFDLILRDPDLD